MTIEKVSDGFGLYHFEINCDKCSYYENVYTEDFLEAICHLKKTGWKVRRNKDDEWEHICPTCSEGGIMSELSREERLELFGWVEVWRAQCLTTDGGCGVCGKKKERDCLKAFKQIKSLIKRTVTEEQLQIWSENLFNMLSVEKHPQKRFIYPTLYNFLTLCMKDLGFEVVSTKSGDGAKDTGNDHK